jgi:tetratricopeptide (TPR) repeat protein
MSKKKKSQKKQGNLSQSTAMLTANGLKAFRQNDLEKALLSWEKIPANLRPAILLAEGHFRRGLALFYGPDTQSGLSHLQTAVAYQPKDPCYAYHLGLAKHHLGDIPGALAAYQTARQFTGPFAARAAYPLALALLQNDQNPAATPVWNDLTPAEQSMLRSASAFRRRPYHLPPESPHLWRSLAAFDAGALSQAQAGLDQVLAGNATAAERSLAHFYQGVIAAQAENWDTARREWEAARMAGLLSPRLDRNLAEIYHRRAEELLLQGDAQTALAATVEAKRHRPDDNALDELLAQIHQHLGYQAAAANHWDEAQSHWQTAAELDSASFRLAYNLALAYERSGSYLSAGQAWREALRRRPRRADHPDALSDDQVARLWQRAAECYHKAGEFDEAGRTYQQAIKWAPENLDLRLALAESLISNGRLLSARNELERLLERSPNHIPALLRLGEAYFHDEDSPWYFKAQAKKCWEKALRIDPKNLRVCQMLAEWYFDQAEIDYSWDRYAEAAEDYQKALEFRPHHLETLAYLAECYIQLKDEPKGEEYARQALAQTATFDDFACIIGMWLRVEYNERAWEVTTQAEARFGNVPTDFYVSMAHQLLENKQKEEALRWLQHAVQKAAFEEGVLVMIGEMAMDVDVSLAKAYLQKALEAGQMPGQAHLIMGILEGRQDNRPASKKHFAEAERIARQTKDADLAERVEMARVIYSDAEGLLRHLMDIGGRGLVEEFLNDLDEEFDDD